MLVYFMAGHKADALLEGTEHESQRQQELFTILTRDMEQVLAAAQPRLRRLTLAYGVSPDAADDLVQEALLTAWRNITQVQAPERLDAWVDGICRNLCRSWFRTRARTALRQTSLDAFFAQEDEQSWQEIFADPAQVDPLDELCHKDLETLLDRALAHLSVTTREIVQLYYLMELPQRTIAQQLGLPNTSLEMRLHRARQQLRQVLSTVLRQDAESLDIPIDLELAEGWRETSIWCCFCGRHHLHGLIERLPDGKANLRMACPECDQQARKEWIYSGPLQAVTGMRTFRPALKYLSTRMAQHIETVKSHACVRCGAPVYMQLVRPEDLPSYEVIHPTYWQGLTLILECAQEGPYSSLPVSMLYWSHPEAQRFIKAHPRWRFAPETLASAEEHLSLHVSLLDLTGPARLDFQVDPHSLQVLRLKEYTHYE